jgi:translation initiation factor IF-2
LYIRIDNIMNISTLSQQLNIPERQLRIKMSELGFGLRPRQRKIDNSVAKKLIELITAEQQPKTEVKQVAREPIKIEIPATIRVKELGALLRVPVADAIKALLKNGVMATINEEIDHDTAAIIATEFGFEVGALAEEETPEIGIEYIAKVLADEKEHMKPRPPIISVMGHVDHGKTTLLDFIRKTNVAQQEKGAITQHIGAYQVEYKGPGAAHGKRMTFLDTPGHEAFAAMRARGANVTDLIVLVVAADEGIQPQTLEVINRAKLTGTPLVVALNKVDKPETNLERIKKELGDAGVVLEEWGGTVPAVPISARTGEGVDTLLETILLASDLEELRANPNGEALGTVIEAHLSRNLGPVATVIVQNGTLRTADPVVAGKAYGRIRSMEDAGGKRFKDALPSMPVRISGLSAVPAVGDILRRVPSIEEARSAALKFLRRERARHVQTAAFEIAPGTTNILLILRADVQGSLEALREAIDKLAGKVSGVGLQVLDAAVGEITDGDVLRAENAGATIIGFHTGPTAQASRLAATRGVRIDLYDIIYEAIEDLTAAIIKIAGPQIVQIVLGKAQVLAVFRVTKEDTVLGGRVSEGMVREDAKVAVHRNGSTIAEGEVLELQQNRIRVKEITHDNEFGLRIASPAKIAVGDTLVFYREEIKEKTLAA